MLKIYFSVGVGYCLVLQHGKFRCITVKVRADNNYTRRFKDHFRGMNGVKSKRAFVFCHCSCIFTAACSEIKKD